MHRTRTLLVLLLAAASPGPAQAAAVSVAAGFERAAAAGAEATSVTAIALARGSHGELMLLAGVPVAGSGARAIGAGGALAAGGFALRGLMSRSTWEDGEEWRARLGPSWRALDGRTATLYATLEGAGAERVPGVLAEGIAPLGGAVVVRASGGYAFDERRGGPRAGLGASWIVARRLELAADLGGAALRAADPRPAPLVPGLGSAPSSTVALAGWTTLAARIWFP